MKHRNSLVREVAVVTLLLVIAATGSTCSPAALPVTPEATSTATCTPTSACLPTMTPTVELSPTMTEMPSGTPGTPTALPTTTPILVPLPTPVVADDRVHLDQYTLFYSTASTGEDTITVEIWRARLDGSDKTLLFKDVRRRWAIGTPSTEPWAERWYSLTGLTLSPDRTKLAFTYVAARKGSTDQPDSSIWVMNVDGSELRELARLNYLGSPSWSPDGSKLFFRGYGGRLFWADVANGYITDMGEGGATSWSPDGQRLAVAIWQGDEEPGIYISDLYGVVRHLIWPITGAPGEGEYAAASSVSWSPDGQKIAFALDFPFESPTGGTKAGCFTISPEGDDLEMIAGGLCSNLQWSPDSKRLSFSLSNDAEHAWILYVAKPGEEPMPIQKRSLEHRWSSDGQAILSCVEGESDNFAFFVEMGAMIRIPIEGLGCSFAW